MSPSQMTKVEQAATLNRLMRSIKQASQQTADFMWDAGLLEDKIGWMHAFEVGGKKYNDLAEEIGRHEIERELNK